MNITISINRDWISSSSSNMFFVNKLGRAVNDYFGDRADVTAVGKGCFKIKFHNNEEYENVMKEIITIVADKMPDNFTEDDIEISVEDNIAEPEKNKTDTNSDPGYDGDSDVNAGSKKINTLDEINSLIGMDDLKAYCNEIAANADAIKKLKNIFYKEAILCVSDDGNGFDENVELLKKLLLENGIIEKHDIVYRDLGSYYDKPDDRKNYKLYNNDSALYVFDIRGWIGYTTDGRIREAFSHYFTANENNIIILRMGNRSKMVIEDTVRDIEDLLNVRVMEFPHLTDEQLYGYALRELASVGIKTDENTPAVFKELTEYEKKDGMFHGIKTVKKIVEEMVRVSFKAGSPGKINSEACKSIIPPADEEDESFGMIEKMIGMESIAAQIREIVTQVLYSRSRHEKAPAMHMFFVGNPGTGKTTVARAIGNIFREKQILRVGKFYEHKGRDLCAEYVGQTAAKVNNICQAAYGSVLFIDEAYSLATARTDKDYGKEAIDTLIAEMENHSDDLVVIFAGYPDEMESLLDTNPGMRSRIPYKITFPNYTREQLHQIFMLMVDKAKYEVTDDFSEHVKNFFLSLPDSFIESKQFGNARYVRNIFERTWSKALLRCPAGKYEIPPLSPADFDAAKAEFEIPATKNKKVGF